MAADGLRRQVTVWVLFRSQTVAVASRHAMSGGPVCTMGWGYAHYSASSQRLLKVNFSCKEEKGV